VQCAIPEEVDDFVKTPFCDNRLLAFEPVLGKLRSRKKPDASHDQELHMRMVRSLAVTFALLVTGTSAFAADSTSQVIKRQAPKSITATFYNCVDKAGSDATAQGACINAEKKVQDTRLNTAYKALTAKLTGNAKTNLLNAERAWLEFHNKNGDFEASLYGDMPVADLQVTQNETFRIAERADALEKYLTIANDQ
jgi:uncharacterized protein YecT (DUF1311 family)